MRAGLFRPFLAPFSRPSASGPPVPVGILPEDRTPDQKSGTSDQDSGPLPDRSRLHPVHGIRSTAAPHTEPDQTPAAPEPEDPRRVRTTGENVVQIR